MLLSTQPTTLPTPTPYNPPNLSYSTEVVVEGLGLEAFPEDLERPFLIQFAVFTLLYALLVRQLHHEQFDN